MEFRWNDWNTQHVAEHGIEPGECETVVRAPSRHYPKYIGDGKWLVWGRGRGDRLLQVICLVDPDLTFFVIHARLLTTSEKSRFKRLNRS